MIGIGCSLAYRSVLAAIILLIPVNLAGLPAITAPCGFIDGMPAGLQLVAPHFAEARLLNVTHQYQQQTDWHLAAPDMSQWEVA